jgi:hypothetical protein
MSWRSLIRACAPLVPSHHRQTIRPPASLTMIIEPLTINSAPTTVINSHSMMFMQQQRPLSNTILHPQYLTRPIRDQNGGAVRHFSKLPISSASKYEIDRLCRSISVTLLVCTYLD